MAEAADDTSEDRITVCSICHESPTHPCSLHCLHTFCSKCIAQWYSDERPGSTVACPVCRNEFVVPDLDTSDLNENVLLGHVPVTSVGNERQKVDEMPLCGICTSEKEKKLAEMVCLQCWQRFCKSCRDAHLKIRLCESHVMVSLDKLESGDENQLKQRSILCVRHTNEPVKLYCLEHKTAICSVCQATVCESHDCKDLKKIAEECLVDLERGNQILKSAINEADANLTDLNLRKQMLHMQVKDAEAKICEKADQLMQSLEIQKQTLITELREIEARCKRKIDNCISVVSDIKSKFTAYTNMCDELSEKGTHVDISREAENLRKRTQELKHMNEEAHHSLPVVNVIFSPCSLTSYDTQQNLLGKVVAEVKPNVVRTQFSEGGIIGALATLNDELFVTRYNVKHISVYDSTTLTFKRNIPVPQLGRKPCGLVACPWNQFLFVSDWDNDCVHRVDLTTVTDNITNWETARGPRGLSLTSKHNLLVTCDWPYQVQEYTATGSLVRELSHDNYPYHAVETSSGTLLVTRSGQTHGVAGFKWDGHVSRFYGNQAGSELSQMNEPRSLAVNSNGDVLVADKDNNRILILDSSLHNARTLHLPDDVTLNSPLALCYDESHNRLFVGESEGGSCVLAFENVFFS